MERVLTLPMSWKSAAQRSSRRGHGLPHDLLRVLPDVLVAPLAVAEADHRVDLGEDGGERAHLEQLVEAALGVLAHHHAIEARADGACASSFTAARKSSSVGGLGARGLTALGHERGRLERVEHAVDAPRRGRGGGDGGHDGLGRGGHGGCAGAPARTATIPAREPRNRAGRRDWSSPPGIGNVGNARRCFTPPSGPGSTGRSRQPTPAQAQGWEEILAGRDTLIAAPTGSGKTLAAFLASLDRLVRPAIRSGPAQDVIDVVYVSPLKALSNDVQRNLEAPLAGIRDAARELGLAAPAIRAALRTGDTTPAARAAICEAAAAHPHHDARVALPDADRGADARAPRAACAP